MARVLKLIRMLCACWFGTLLLLAAVGGLTLPLYYILAYIEFVLVAYAYPTGSVTGQRIQNVTMAGGVAAVGLVAYESLTFAGAV